MIKNVIFDVGKVLVEYDPDSYMERLGFDLKTRQAVNQAMFQNPLWEESDRGKLSTEELLEKFIFNDKEYKEEITKAYQTVGNTIELFPYSVAWIKELKQRGYRVYILSNYAEVTYDKELKQRGYRVYILSNYAEVTYEQTKEKMEFLPYVDGAVFSFQCKWIKPEREIYEELCRKYSIEPRESVFLDDRLDNIEQARNLGFFGIQFESYQQAVKELERILNEG